MEEKDREEKIFKIIELMVSIKKYMLPGSYYNLESIGINRAEAELLMLMENSGSISVKNASQSICSTVSAVSHTVKSLTEKKLINREHSTEDLRQVNLKLTDKGKKKLGEFKEIHLRYVKNATTQLTEDDIEQFIVLLEKIYSSVIDSR
jgi:DNA-binding MarR family transcriptional regulator